MSFLTFTSICKNCVNAILTFTCGCENCVNVISDSVVYWGSRVCDGASCRKCPSSPISENMGRSQVGWAVYLQAFSHNCSSLAQLVNCVWPSGSAIPVTAFAKVLMRDFVIFFMPPDHMIRRNCRSALLWGCLSTKLNLTCNFMPNTSNSVCIYVKHFQISELTTLWPWHWL